MSEEETKPSIKAAPAGYVKVDTLRPRVRNVNVMVKVVSKTPARDVTSRKDYTIHSVADALVGDETGCVIFTLWDKKINEFNGGDVIDIRNGHTSLFKGYLRLNIGRFGTAEKVDKEVGEVNMENNLSEKRHETMWYRPTRRPFRRRRRRY